MSGVKRRIRRICYYPLVKQQELFDERSLCTSGSIANAGESLELSKEIVMSNTTDRFQQLRESFRGVGQAFGEVEGARLIPSFSSITEEEYTPDLEKREEDKLLTTDNLWAREAETDFSDSITRDFRGAKRCFNLTYFVDGSLRTVRALDGMEGNFVFPIVIGEIGAASIKRNSQNEPVKQHLETKVVLLIPLSQLSDTLGIHLTNQLDRTLLEGEIHDPLDSEDVSQTRSPGDEKDYAELRSRAGRRAKYLMAGIEKEVLESCVEELTSATELVVLDGTLIGMLKEAQISEDKIDRVIGISKSFSMKPLILLQEHFERDDYISQLLNLKEGERTNALELHLGSDWVVTWYQRIRPRQRVESPLDGIVKVETHFANYPVCKSQTDPREFKTDWSKIYDEIANTVYAERLPIPFHEQRWHALLYPIYCCERLLKSSFLSLEVLRGLCSRINV